MPVPRCLDPAGIIRDNMDQSSGAYPPPSVWTTRCGPRTAAGGYAPTLERRLLARRNRHRFGLTSLAVSAPSRRELS